MKVRILLPACLAVLLVAGVVSTVLPRGRAAPSRSNITPGARADGMGRANVALSNDATSNWWNPAAWPTSTSGSSP